MQSAVLYFQSLNVSHNVFPWLFQTKDYLADPTAFAVAAPVAAATSAPKEEKKEEKKAESEESEDDDMGFGLFD